MSDHLTPNFQMNPEDMDRPELIATVKLLRTHLTSASRDHKILNDRVWNAERRLADESIGLRQVEDCNDHLRAQIKNLNAEIAELKSLLECAKGDRNTESEMRLSLEERLEIDLKEVNQALGVAAVRVLSLLERINPL